MSKSFPPTLLPAVCEVQLMLGLLDAGQRALAEAALRKGLVAHPQKMVFHNVLGYGLAAQRQWAEAIESIRKAAEGAPQSLETHSQLGMLYSQMGRNEEGG